MPLKQFTIDFQELGKEKSLRYDVDFVDFQNEFLAERYYSFSDLFEFSSENKVDIEKFDDDIFYSEIGNVSKEGDVEPVRLNFSVRKEEEENYYKKIEKGDIIKARENDILLSKVRPNLKKYVFINGDTKDYFYTSAFIHLIPRKLNKILYYSFRTIFYENLIAISRQGKGYPTLKENDFSYLKFDKKIIDKLSEKQDQIVSQIELIEKKVKVLKAQIIPPQEIINKVFAREFGFDLGKFEELKKERFFEVNFAKISNYHSLRFDVKNQKYLDVFNDIIKTFGSSFFLKPISKDKGKYGANEPAKDGEKSIDTRYIRITDIDGIGNLRDDDWKTTENIDEQYLLKDDDFLFARSGNTVGKTFLYDSNKHEEAIFAGYFIKFNLDFTNLDKLFFLYYTKSFIYNFWIRGIVRIKGQPNINANEYLELKIPNITLKDQQKIVDEIKGELNKQEEINKKIQTERNEIDEIIEKAIK
jgi:type I restriction enzyme, S subunit